MTKEVGNTDIQLLFSFVYEQCFLFHRLFDLFPEEKYFCPYTYVFISSPHVQGERGGSVVECRTPEREVRGSRPTAAVLCP